jgi:hypothetical protein
MKRQVMDRGNRDDDRATHPAEIVVPLAKSPTLPPAARCSSTGQASTTRPAELAPGDQLITTTECREVFCLFQRDMSNSPQQQLR